MWKTLGELIWRAVRAVVKLAKPTVEDGEAPGKREERLREQIKKEGW